MLVFSISVRIYECGTSQNGTDTSERTVEFYSLDKKFCQGGNTRIAEKEANLSDLHWKYFYSNRIDAYDMSILTTGRRLDTYLLDDKTKTPAWTTAEPILDRILEILEVPKKQHKITHYSRKEGDSDWVKTEKTQLSSSSSKSTNFHASFSSQVNIINLKYIQTIDDKIKRALNPGCVHKLKFDLLKQVFNHPSSITTLHEAHLLVILLAEFMMLSKVEFKKKEAIVDSILAEYSILQNIKTECTRNSFIQFAKRRNCRMFRKDPIYKSKEILSGLADWNVIYNAGFRLGMILGTTTQFGLDPEKYRKIQKNLSLVI